MFLYAVSHHIGFRETFFYKKCFLCYGIHLAQMAYCGDKTSPGVLLVFTGDARVLIICINTIASECCTGTHWVIHEKSLHNNVR